MSGLLPAAVYGLEVPAGDVMIPAVADFPAAFRITMAAIDPSAEPEISGNVIDGVAPRATLKLIRQPMGPGGGEEDSDYDSEEEAELKALLNGEASDEDESSSGDEEVNGGPSDPSKTKKARKEAAIEALKNALESEADDEEMSVDGANGLKLDKGKGVATGDEDGLSEEDSEEMELEEFVICTLDPAQHYQQTLDITVGEDEKVFFKVSGTHSIFLTGNYVIPVDDSPSRMYGNEEDKDYDLSPDEDETDELEDDESDALDGLDDPRITEVASEDEVPQLVKAKGKNKRPVEESDDEPPGLDEIMAKSLKPAEPTTNGEVKLSKKQKKKLKNNAGEAVATAAVKKDAKKDVVSSESPSGKKVQFAKNLEQGPSGTKSEAKIEVKNDKKLEKKDGNKPKSTLGVKVVQGVTVDDKKLGTGPAAKKGNKISMRYIGKLTDGKVFDANKKGKPFSFKLGAGEVIKGWEIGVEGITVGGERRITIPAGLAYGNKAMPSIPANSQLVFDIKCLEIH